MSLPKWLTLSVALLSIPASALALESRQQQRANQQRFKPAPKLLTRTTPLALLAAPQSKSEAQTAKPKATHSPEVEKLLDQIAMLQLGHQGSTQAHMFLEREALYPGKSPADYRFRLPAGAKSFWAPKND